MYMLWEISQMWRMPSVFGSVDYDLFLDCSPHGINLCLGCTRLAASSVGVAVTMCLSCNATAVSYC